MRRCGRYVLATCLALVTIGAATRTDHNADSHLRISLVATSPLQATHSDLAFWGNHAFVGYYAGSAGFPPGSGSRGGVRIFDVSDPKVPA